MRIDGARVERLLFAASWDRVQHFTTVEENNYVCIFFFCNFVSVRVILKIARMRLHLGNSP